MAEFLDMSIETYFLQMEDKKRRIIVNSLNETIAIEIWKSETTDDPPPPEKVHRDLNSLKNAKYFNGKVQYWLTIWSSL